MHPPGGLVVPKASFFPANFINEPMVEQITLVPVPVYRSLFGLLKYALIVMPSPRV